MSAPPPYDAKGPYPPAQPMQYPGAQPYPQPYPQAQQGYPPQQPYPQPQQAYPQQPYPQPHTAYPHQPASINVTVGQPAPTTTVVLGGCQHVFTDYYDCCAIALAIIFFPIGLLCCLCMKRSRCVHCGAIV